MSDSAGGERKGRKPIRCRRCGMIKRGHTCPVTSVLKNELWDAAASLAVSGGTICGNSFVTEPTIRNERLALMTRLWERLQCRLDLTTDVMPQRHSNFNRRPSPTLVRGHQYSDAPYHPLNLSANVLPSPDVSEAAQPQTHRNSDQEHAIMQLNSGRCTDLGADPDGSIQGGEKNPRGRWREASDLCSASELPHLGELAVPEHAARADVGSLSDHVGPHGPLHEHFAHRDVVHSVTEAAHNECDSVSDRVCGVIHSRGLGGGGPGMSQLGGEVPWGAGPSLDFSGHNVYPTPGLDVAFNGTGEEGEGEPGGVGGVERQGVGEG